jgi:hypothetical protein
MALQVVDRAMQAFGAEGLSQDQELPFIFANLRTLRIADVSRPGFYPTISSLTSSCSIQGPDAVRRTWLQRCFEVLIILYFRYTSNRLDDGS